MNKKGQTPYIEYNGFQYCDSNLIIDFLKEEFNVDCDKDVKDDPLGHAVTRMVENHTAQIGFCWRSVLLYEVKLLYRNFNPRTNKLFN